MKEPELLAKPNNVYPMRIHASRPRLVIGSTSSS